MVRGEASHLSKVLVELSPERGEGSSPAAISIKGQGQMSESMTNWADSTHCGSNDPHANTGRGHTTDPNCSRTTDPDLAFGSTLFPVSAKDPQISAALTA